MADKTKIDWAEASWNPVTGCRHDCPYCYARNTARHYGAHLCDPVKKENHELAEPMRKNGISLAEPYPYDFEPTFFRYRLDIPARWQRPRNIFVCSMADLFGDWVPDEWIREVFAACKKAPQHRYLFLTKAPERFKKLLDNGIMFPENCWIGTSVTRSEDAQGNENRIDRLTDTWPVEGVKWFVSVEPILEDLSEKAIENLAQTDWVIIGAETGRRKNLTVPDKSWIDRIAKICAYYHTPVFMKGSLQEIMGADFIQQYPWEG